MSILSHDTFTVSDSIVEAVRKVAESGIDPNIKDVLLEDETSSAVHIPGYGVLSKERAQKEAHLSANMAHGFAQEGKHSHAAYHYERAAMFHKALHNHSKIVAGESVVTTQPAVKEETKEPELGRVSAKYARQKSRDNKQKDKEKQDKNENKWQ